MSNVAKQSFCSLTSMELFHIPNCNSLYLHSNNMNSLKSLFEKKSYIQNPTNKAVQRLGSLDRIIINGIYITIVKLKDHMTVLRFHGQKNNQIISFYIEHTQAWFVPFNIPIYKSALTV